jgi:hypothetical protein
MPVYRPFEMHCHTQHSDGQFTVPELLRSAAAYGYAGLALTDHNAVTGARDLTPQLERETCPVIRGIEWTTFYGHLLVLGCRRFVDWRFVTPDTIDDALAEIRSAGGVAGVAHPCEVGSPLMCGCNWEFRVTRWDLVDYVEIWSGPDPASAAKNALALPWYDALLNAGHRLAVSAGRDWHGPDAPGRPPVLTATYLGIEGAVTEAHALQAIRAGRTYVTLGPTLELSLRQGEQTLSLGQTAAPGPAEVQLSVGLRERRALWACHGIQPEYLRLVSNGRVLADLPCAGEGTVSASLSLEEGWLRAELHGRDETRSQLLLALTSPVYIRAR